MFIKQTCSFWKSTKWQIRRLQYFGNGKKDGEKLHMLSISIVNVESKVIGSEKRVSCTNIFKFLIY